jgi:hypothetical protein
MEDLLPGGEFPDSVNLFPDSVRGKNKESPPDGGLSPG